MRTILFILPLLFSSMVICAQTNPCLNQFMNDSVVKPGEKTATVVNALTVNLKTGQTIQFINGANKKLYVRIKTNDKLGFIPEGGLELKSGSKSIYFKTNLHNINKTNPYFIVDVGINYIATLKDYGMSGLVFNSHEIKFIKEDIKAIKETANCFYVMNTKK